MVLRHLWSLWLCATLVIASSPTSVHAEDSGAGSVFDRILLQLNWGDDNLLLGAGETRENSPDPNFGRCSRTQIDGVPKRDCAQGATRLGLYKSIAIDDSFKVEGALVVGLGVDTNPESSKAGNVQLFDMGSYLRISKDFGSDGDTFFYAEFFPVDARPLKLGFHADIEWGTRDEFPRNFRRGAAPGIKLGLGAGIFYAFLGAKTALLKSPLEIELQNEGGNRILFATRTYYGLLGGFGLGEDEGFKFEANGGFFHKGTLTKEGVLGKDILSGGGSARLAYSDGEPVGRRINSGLYQRSAVGASVINSPSYEDELAWSLAAEGSLRMQTLSDFERPDSTANELSYASHLGFKLRWDKLRTHVEGRVRSLTFITAEVPGFFPYATLPENSETTPELQGLLSVDYRFGPVTLALTGGLRIPSTYKGIAPQGSGTDPATAGNRTVVVSDSDSGGWYILPSGEEALLVWWSELGVKWQPAEEFALIGDVLFGQDPNRTQVERDNYGHAVRVFTQQNVLAINLLAQLLF